MKNTLLTLCLLMPLLSFSQIKKGDIYLRLNMQGTAFVQTKTNSPLTNYTNIPLSEVSIGRFINDKNALGVGVTFGYNYYEGILGYMHQGAGLNFSHWYINPIGKNWGVSFSNELGAGVAKPGFYDFQFKYATFYSIQCASRLGLYALLFNKFSATASFNLLSAKFTQQVLESGHSPWPPTPTYKTFDISGGIPSSVSPLTFNVQFAWFINKKFSML